MGWAFEGEEMGVRKESNEIRSPSCMALLRTAPLRDWLAYLIWAIQRLIELLSSYPPSMVPLLISTRSNWQQDVSSFFLLWRISGA